MCRVHWVPIADEQALDEATKLLEGTEDFWMANALPVAEDLEGIEQLLEHDDLGAIAPAIKTEEDAYIHEATHEPASDDDPCWEPEASPSDDASAVPRRPAARAAPKPRARSRGGRSKRSSEEEKRMRNREIQARYRAKKKAQRESVETTYNNICDELDRARDEHESRSAKVALLENLRSFKDSAIAVLERSATTSHKTVDVSVPLTSATPADITDLSSSTSASSKQVSTLLPISIVDGIYQTLSRDVGHAIWGISDAYAAAEHLKEEHGGDLSRIDQRFALIVSMVKKMTGEQLVNGWTRFARALGDALDEHRSECTGNGSAATSSDDESSVSSMDSIVEWSLEDPPAMLAKVQPLFQEQIVILSMAMQCNLPAVEKFMAMNPSGGDATARWREIAASLNITDAQRSALLKEFRTYREEVASRRESRARAVTEMIASAGQPNTSSLISMVNEYLAVYDCADRLAASPHAELHAHFNLMRAAGSVFTVMQRAQMVAMACPAFPDTAQLIMALESDA